VTERRAPVASDASAAPAVEVETPLAGGQPPVDQARVNEIRKAIEADRYPVIPMRVADALIASGLLLRSGK
jgi:negative regulator of flagellin synthesis FlgM